MALPAAIAGLPGTQARSTRAGVDQVVTLNHSIALASIAAGLAACGTTAPPAEPLAGTRWQLAAIQSMDDSQGTVQPSDPSRYTLAFGADGRVAVRLDCNRGVATWQAQPAAGPEPGRRSGQLVLGPLASTRAACAPGSLAPRLAGSWPFVRGYLIESGRLHLSLMADGGILSWVPAP
jgi:heat shock protein HslJ